MVHRTKSKPWKITLLYLSVFLFTISSKALAQDTETTQLQQNILQSHQLYEAHEEEDHTKRGQELYDQALERLQPLINVQLPHSNSKKSPLRDRATGITGLYHIGMESLWNLIDTYATTAFSSTDDNTNEHQQQHTPSTKLKPTQSDSQQLLLEATQLLEEAGNNFGNKDALFLLAEMYFYEKYTQQRDYKRAFDYYQKLANTGNATAQQMIGFMYATGIGNAIQRDQAQAFLHHTFAAFGEDTAAEMTLGYRYLLGIGTERSYTDAVYYYKHAAQKAIDHYLSGPPGGLAPPLPKLRLADDKGGLYGQGASVMTDKYHRSSADKSVSIDEVLQYLRYLAFTKKDVEAQLKLGEMYYHGSRNVQRDFGEAFDFFQAVVSKLPSSSSKFPDSLVKSEHGKAIGQAAGYLGKMFLRGEGVKANSEMAYKMFTVGTKLQDSASMNGLGMIELNGEKNDYESALFHFKQAAALKNADARVNLALEYIKDPATLTEGIKLFELAAESSKHLLAYWYLGQIYEKGIGMDRPSSQHAVSFYKAIAERGDWLHPTIDNAYYAYMNGDMEGALLSYMLAAERGYEIAQSNVAYLLDTDKVALNLPERLGLEESPKRDNYSEELALIYYSRSANQNNVDSRVKMGDYYYRGIGTNVDYDMAAACYRVAAELEASPMAFWNLGWMYENGIGVAKDFHLAKRAYDDALTANGNAYLPVKLSLIKLYAKYYWEWLTGGDVDHEFFSDEQKQQQQNQQSPHHHQQQQQQQQQDGGDDSHHDSMGLSEEAAAIKEARRRKQIEGHDDHDRQWGERSTEDELRRQYNKHKELEDYENYDDLNGGNDVDDDDYSEQDELIESLIILGIGILVGWLVYVRQFGFGNNAQAAAQQRQRQQQQQQQEQEQQEQEQHHHHHHHYQQHSPDHHDSNNESSPPPPPPQY